MRHTATYEEGAAECVQGAAGVALERARGMRAHAPEDGWLLALEGLALRHLGRLTEARQVLEQATCVIPLPLAAALALAECYLREKRHDVARLMYCQLARQANLPFHLLAPLASALGRLDECELALAVCRRAAAAAPEADEPLFAMAYFLRRLRRPPEVILPVLEQAVRMAPDSPTYRLALAGVLADLSDFDRACQILSRVAIDGIACLTCLARMETIFARAGNAARRDECAERALSLRAAGRAPDSHRC